MKKKKNGFDPSKFVIEHGKLTVGTMGVMGLAGRMPHSPSSSKIVGGMDTLKVLPTVHATGGVFGSLRGLEDTVKKKRRTKI